MKTTHAAVDYELSRDTLCGKRGVRAIDVRVFVKQGSSAAWGGKAGRRCRTCLVVARGGR